MKTKIWNILESIHYSALIALFVLLLIVICVHHTQSITVQRMHQIEFEQCVNGEYSDTVCEECYAKIMDHHNYWFNNKLYPGTTVRIR